MLSRPAARAVSLCIASRMEKVIAGGLSTPGAALYISLENEVGAYGHAAIQLS